MLRTLAQYHDFHAEYTGEEDDFFGGYDEEEIRALPQEKPVTETAETTE